MKNFPKKNPKVSGMFPIMSEMRSNCPDDKHFFSIIFGGGNFGCGGQVWSCVPILQSFWHPRSCVAGKFLKCCVQHFQHIRRGRQKDPLQEDVWLLKGVLGFLCTPFRQNLDFPKMKGGLFKRGLIFDIFVWLKGGWWIFRK